MYKIRDVSDSNFNIAVNDYTEMYCDLISHILTKYRLKRETPTYEVIYCGCGEANPQQVSAIYEIIDKAISKCSNIEMEAYFVSVRMRMFK